MRSRTTKQFRELLADLPLRLRKRARDAYEQFMQNPNHPGLQFKRVHTQEPIWSIRVSVSYRALGRWRDNGIVWFWIGSHAEYDELLKRL